MIRCGWRNWRQSATCGRIDGQDARSGYNGSGQLRQRARSNNLYAFGGYANGAEAYSVNGLDEYAMIASASRTRDSIGTLRTNGTAIRSIAMIYEPLGRLYETSGGTPGTRCYVYDDDALVLEYDTGGSVIARYVHGPGVD